MPQSAVLTLILGGRYSLERARKDLNDKDVHCKVKGGGCRKVSYCSPSPASQRLSKKTKGQKVPQKRCINTSKAADLLRTYVRLHDFPALRERVAKNEESARQEKLAVRRELKEAKKTYEAIKKQSKSEKSKKLLSAKKTYEEVKKRYSLAEKTFDEAKERHRIASAAARKAAAHDDVPTRRLAPPEPGSSVIFDDKRSERDLDKAKNILAEAWTAFHDALRNRQEPGITKELEELARKYNEALEEHYNLQSRATAFRHRQAVSGDGDKRPEVSLSGTDAQAGGQDVSTNEAALSGSPSAARSESLTGGANVIGEPEDTSSGALAERDYGGTTVDPDEAETGLRSPSRSTRSREARLRSPSQALVRNDTANANFGRNLNASPLSPMSWRAQEDETDEVAAFADNPNYRGPLPMDVDTPPSTPNPSEVEEDAEDSQDARDIPGAPGTPPPPMRSPPSPLSESEVEKELKVIKEEEQQLSALDDEAGTCPDDKRYQEILTDAEEKEINIRMRYSALMLKNLPESIRKTVQERFRDFQRARPSD